MTLADSNRAKSYKKIKNLNKIKSNSSNLEKFLKELKPTINLSKINKSNISRASQLLEKTNQFKFNNNIFSIKELEKLKDNIIVISFKDSIQNYGIIGVLVLEYKKENLTIEIKNWVLSCRIFSRRLENYILEYIVKLAKKIKYDKINFVLNLTKKNKYLQIFLKRSNITIKKNKEKYSIKISNIKNREKNYIRLEKN